MFKKLAVASIFTACVAFAQSGSVGQTKYVYQNLNSSFPERFGGLSQFFNILPPQIQVLVIAPNVQDVTYKVSLSYVDANGATQRIVRLFPSDTQNSGRTLCTVMLDLPSNTIVAVDIQSTSASAIPVNQ